MTARPGLGGQEAVPHKEVEEEVRGWEAEEEAPGCGGGGQGAGGRRPGLRRWSGGAAEEEARAAAVEERRRTAEEEARSVWRRPTPRTFVLLAAGDGHHQRSPEPRHEDHGGILRGISYVLRGLSFCESVRCAFACPRAKVCLCLPTAALELKCVHGAMVL